MIRILIFVNEVDSTLAEKYLVTNFSDGALLATVC